MPTVLITGASRGIGLEFARQFAADGWTVLAGVRDPATARALMAVDGDVAVVSLDVADPASVAILAERLRGIPIDILVNNAGVYGHRRTRLGDLDYANWLETMTINLFGTVRVTEAFLDHVKDGETKKIAVLTSKMGSIADNRSGGSYFYRSSKAALNAAMRSIALDLTADRISVAILHPGWVLTDMTAPGGLIDPPESVAGMRRVIDQLSLETTGQFWNYDGSPIPW